MVTPELLAYIQAELPNFTPEQISDRLVSSGWNPADVKAALAQVTPSLSSPQPTARPPLKSRRGLFLTILILVVVGAGGAYAYTNNYFSKSPTPSGASSEATATPEAVASPTPSPTPKTSLIKEWLPYTTTKTTPQFTFDYPPDWQVNENSTSADETFVVVTNSTPGVEVRFSVNSGPKVKGYYLSKESGEAYNRPSITLHSHATAKIDGYSAVRNIFSTVSTTIVLTSILINDTTTIDVSFVANSFSETSNSLNSQVYDGVLSTWQVNK